MLKLSKIKMVKVEHEKLWSSGIMKIRILSKLYHSFYSVDYL